MKISIIAHIKRVCFLLSASLFVLLTIPQVASAQLTQPFDTNAVYGNWPTWVIPGVCSTASVPAPAPSGNVGGNANAKTAFDFFLGNGYTPQQAAGILGNLIWESGGVNPTQGQIGGGGGYGIAQWTPPTAMQAWVTAKGEDPNSLQGQLDFLLFDLNNGNSFANTKLKATNTVKDATDAFETFYERAGIAAIPQREALAQAAFLAFGGDVGTTGGGNNSNCGTPAGGTADCTTATGDAKILCTAKEYNGIFYLFGGAHGGYANFRAGCPLTFLPSAAAQSSPGNPGPCATDCSGLVSMALDQVFNQTFDWSVHNNQMSGAGGNFWQPISIGTVQPGDIVTFSGGGDDHVEIVDHFDTASGQLYTFGSHSTGTKTGQVTSTLGSWTGALHWTGPTS